MVTRQDLVKSLSARPAIPQFNAYAAGAKHYGGGRAAPNVGKTANKTGYAMRDAKRRAITGGR